MPTVKIFGAGPAGFMAAWSALEAGWEPYIVDRHGSMALLNVARRAAGVFLLHEKCGLHPLQGHVVSYRTIGSGLTRNELAEMYRQKVYGEAKPELVSIVQYGEGSRTEYDGHAAYALLIDLLKHFVQHDPGLADVEALADASREYDAVISTVPLSIFLPPSNCWYADAWVKEGVAPSGESYVWYAPQPTLPWYRASGVFGHFTLEYATPPPVNVALASELRQIQKPIARSKFATHWMKEMPHNVFFTGRFGAWQKGLETDDVYEGTKRFLRRDVHAASADAIATGRFGIAGETTIG